MKKKLVLGLLLGLSVFFVGCGQQPVVEPDTEEIIEVSINTTVKSPMDLSKDELINLSAEEIKEMVEIYLPNYRDIYGISEETVMSDEDWMNLRDLMVYQLYGVVVSTYKDYLRANIDWSKPFEIVGDDGSYLDPDWIYYAPSREYIAGLSTEEFANYMHDFMAYNGYEEENNSFLDLSEEELENMRLDAYENICKDWGSVEIPTLNQIYGDATASDNAEYDEEGNLIIRDEEAVDENTEETTEEVESEDTETEDTSSKKKN